MKKYLLACLWIVIVGLMVSYKPLYIEEREIEYY